MTDRPLIIPAEMCKLHQSLLIHQAGYKETDPWRALIIMAQIALFQGATADPICYDKINGDITRISELGCLACFKPDRFGEIVEVAKRKGSIKELGESWIKDNG